MKKLSTLLAVILSVGLLASCAPAEKTIEGDLTELITKLYEGVPEDKMVGTLEAPITKEMSETFTGVTIDKYKEAVSSDALINAQAHSVVLVRANSVDEAEALAKEIEEKSNPNKWTCVQAEKKIVDRVGDTIVLIMTFEDIAEQIHQNFLALAK